MPRRKACQIDIVVFRKWKDTGTVIALFPELPADIHGRYCDAYEHIGQHGGADYYGVIEQTLPATSSESAPLIKELTTIGYRLISTKRVSSRMHQTRRKSVARD